MLDKSKFIKQTESSVSDYFEKNIEELSLLRALQNYDLHVKEFNTFCEYLQDWFSLQNSKLYKDLKDNYKFILHLAETDIPELQKNIYLSKSLQKEDLKIIKDLSATAKLVYSNISKLDSFIKMKAEKEYPNLTSVLGPVLCVRFICQLGSLKRLSEVPSSTIQLIGAEKALFRHLKYGKSTPKYGLLYLHPIMSGLDNNKKGKLARFMSLKISLAARYDLTGKPLDKSLIKEIENKKKEFLGSKRK